MNLIDMDRLRKELMAKGDIPIHEVFNTIWEQPIVNISQPKMGHWIAMSEGFTPYECSECEAVEFKKSKYCPNCGCRMKGEDE